jgi:hypothetical protein
MVSESSQAKGQPMNQFPTTKEEIALDLIFAHMGGSRFNRTAEEYAAITSKLPPIKVLHGFINDLLKKGAEAGLAPYRLCYFRAGDRRAWLEDFPKSLSIETVRSALLKAGMRERRSRKR